MADEVVESTQERLLREYWNEQLFGDPHDFAARAEITDLRNRIAELEGKKHGKAEKGRSADNA